MQSPCGYRCKTGSNIPSLDSPVRRSKVTHVQHIERHKDPSLAEDDDATESPIVELYAP